MRDFFSRQFVTFLITGGVAALVNFSSRILYNQWMGYSPAIVLAYLTGMITAFILARKFVFTASTQTTHRSAMIFTLVNLVAVAQTWAISLLLAEIVLPAMGILRFAHDIGHAVGIAVPVFTSYLGHKYFSFAAPPS